MHKDEDSGSALPRQLAGVAEHGRHLVEAERLQLLHVAALQGLAATNSSSSSRLAADPVRQPLDGVFRGIHDRCDCVATAGHVVLTN